MNGATETKTDAAATMQADKKDQAKKPACLPVGDGQAKPKRRKPTAVGKPRSTAPGGQKGSHGAKRTAAAILEVLAGARSPTEAAEALGVSANRYYQLEARAIQGLIGACEPRSKGKVVSPEKQLVKLRHEADKLRNEAARFQALARASQKTIGLAAPKPTTSKKGGKRRRRRKPVVRALTVAKALSPTAEAVTSPPETLAGSHTAGGPPATVAGR